MGENCEVHDSRIEIRPTMSVRPKGSRSLRADSTGLAVVLPWGVWAALITVLFGGGGSCIVFKLVTSDQMQQAIAASERKQSTDVKTLATEVKNNSKSLKTLGRTVGQVQLTQQMDIAVREARRVVDEEMDCNQQLKGCRDKREDARERIRRVNMRRLKVGKEPCSDISCQ